MAKRYRRNFKNNSRIILVATSIVIWFYGITGILDIITNNSKKLEIYLLLLFLSLCIFYFDDFSLSELHMVNEN